jgi:riboflavin synthase
MFTGLIEEVGTVLQIQATDRGTQLQVVAPRIAEKIELGESVAVNGCCLTVAARLDDQLAFDLLDETLRCTNLKTLRGESRVNLERALAAGGRLGGHFVQGHVDCAAPILALEKQGADYRVEVELPDEFARYVASKGSIALNGISLTVAEVSKQSFAVWIIPHTRAETNLDTARPADLVNLEFDLIAKYVERLLDRHSVRSSS